jgi:hypothetical protein
MKSECFCKILAHTRVTVINPRRTTDILGSYRATNQLKTSMYIDMWKKKVDMAFSLQLPVGTEKIWNLKVKIYTIEIAAIMFELHQYLSKM